MQETMQRILPLLFGHRSLATVLLENLQQNGIHSSRNQQLEKSQMPMSNIMKFIHSQICLCCVLVFSQTFAVYFLNCWQIIIFFFIVLKLNNVKKVVNMSSFKLYLSSVWLVSDRAVCDIVLKETTIDMCRNRLHLHV